MGRLLGGRALSGVLISNSDGNWVKGFARGLGDTNSCLAELWALRDGLNLASNLGILHVIVETGNGCCVCYSTY